MKKHLLIICSLCITIVVFGILVTALCKAPDASYSGNIHGVFDIGGADNVQVRLGSSLPPFPHGESTQDVVVQVVSCGGAIFVHHFRLPNPDPKALGELSRFQFAAFHKLTRYRKADGWHELTTFGSNQLNPPAAIGCINDHFRFLSHRLNLVRTDQTEYEYDGDTMQPTGLTVRPPAMTPLKDGEESETKLPYFVQGYIVTKAGQWIAYGRKRLTGSKANCFGSNANGDVVSLSPHGGDCAAELQVDGYDASRTSMPSPYLPGTDRYTWNVVDTEFPTRTWWSTESFDGRFTRIDPPLTIDVNVYTGKMKVGDRTVTLFDSEVQNGRLRWPIDPALTFVDQPDGSMLMLWGTRYMHFDANWNRIDSTSWLRRLAHAFQHSSWFANLKIFFALFASAMVFALRRQHARARWSWLIVLVQLWAAWSIWFWTSGL
jgi:hypothetical protein